VSLTNARIKPIYHIFDGRKNTKKNYLKTRGTRLKVSLIISLPRLL
jgi:hypothetical protein